MTSIGLLNEENSRFVQRRRTGAGVLPFALSCLLGLATPLFAQTSEGFVPGGRELFGIDFAQEPVGGFPAVLRNLRGSMEVVVKDGKRMLRASDSAEFLVTLPEALPEHITLEFDLVTRADYSNEEFAFEGTPAFNRGAASANVLWYRGSVSVLGGREAGNAYINMPPEVTAELSNQPVEVRVDLNGTRLQVYTNGRKVVNLPDVKFVRGRVLRVFLGGHDAGPNAVHLSRLRIADASSSTPAVAQQQHAVTGATAAATGATSPQGITGITPHVNSLGTAWVTWDPLPVAATYVVLRWKVDDPTCCNAMSPPGQPLTGNGWQDGTLGSAGTYAYRVIATTATGVVAGEVRFEYRGPGTTVNGMVASVSSAPTNTETNTTSTAIGPTIATATAPLAPVLMSPTATGTVTPIVQTSAPSAPPPPPSAPPPPAPAAAPTAGRYRVVLAGFLMTKESFDDPLERDGRRNEAYGAAAVVTWDRRLNQQRSIRFLKTREYGDVRDGVPFPGRIKAGSATPQGGIWGGDRVPEGYDPAGAVLPAATEAQFPLLLWDGTLTAGVEAIAVFPSVWERDTDAQAFEKYREDWSERNAGPMMTSSIVLLQTARPNLAWDIMPLDAGQVAGEVAKTMLLWPLGPLNLVAGVLGLSPDRPVGIVRENADTWLYQERVVVITQEKLAALAVGGGVTVAIPYTDSPDQTLGGALTLYLRVERIN